MPAFTSCDGSSLGSVPDAIHIALIESLLGCLAFLEHGGDDVIDPDAAVRAMENMAHPLMSLPESDRAALVAMIQQVAAAAPDDGWRRFVLSAPYGMGLTEDPGGLLRGETVSTDPACCWCAAGGRACAGP